MTTSIPESSARVGGGVRFNISNEELTSSNRSYFNDLAHKSDRVNPLRERVLNDIAEAILEEFEFDEDKTELMEYACGTGLTSQRLAPYCKTLIGVDISEDSVARFNMKVMNQGISPEEMHAIYGEIGVKDDDDRLEFGSKKFDVVVCSQGYHHFYSIEKVTRGLAKYLKPITGILIVVDLIRSGARVDARDGITTETGGVDQHLHKHSTVVAHPGGFTEQEIRAAFSGAGLLDISFRSFTEFKKLGKVVEMFIATGRVEGTPSV